MSTLLVNTIQSVTGDTVTISGSNIIVQGNTLLGDGTGNDTITTKDNIVLSGSIFVSGSVLPFYNSTAANNVPASDIGSLTHRWRRVHAVSGSFSDDLDVKGDLEARFITGSKIKAVSSFETLAVASDLIPQGAASSPSGSLGGHISGLLLKWKNLFVASASIDYLGTANIPVTASHITSASFADINMLGNVDDATLHISGTTGELSIGHFNNSGDKGFKIGFDDRLQIGGSGDAVQVVTGTKLQVSSSQVDFNSLPNSDPGVAGRLYTLPGSQLGLGGITGSIATKKFVFVSAG